MACDFDAMPGLFADYLITLDLQFVPGFDPGAAGILAMEAGFDLDDFLTAQGFSVIGPVSTIDAALGLLMQQRPDLAVLDLDLRGKNATPVAAALRKYGVPFVVASGAEHLEQLLDKRTEFSDILNVGKPIRGGRLVKILETLLHTKALH